MTENQEQLYNEFADVPALEAQKKEVLEIFAEVKAGIKSLAQSGIKIDGAKSIQQLTAAEKEYNAYVKQTENLVKQLQDSEAKLVTIRQKEALQLAENKLRLKELNKEQSERIRLQNAEKGSIEQLELKYAKAYRIFKQLGESQRDTARGQALNKYLEDTSNKLNELKKSAGNFSSNVGRYAGSLAKPFETLINKVDELKANLSKGIGIGGSDEASLKRAAQAITIIENTLESSSAAGTTTVKQVKNLGNAFTDLSVTIGKADSSTFLSNLGLQIGEAKDEAADLKDQLKLNASDTKGIDNVVGSLNALAGVAQGAAGAYALIGANGEDAAVVTSKLIAIQGIANSVQQVGQELTRKGTTANKIYATVLGLVTTATDSSAAATTRLAAASKLLIGGAIIGTIIYLAVNYAKLKNSISDAARESKLLNDVNKEAAQIAGTQIAALDSLYRVSTNANIPIKKRKEAVDEIQKQYPEYFKNVKDEIILQGKAADAYDRTKDSILEKAKATAIESKLAALSTEQLQKEFDLEDKVAKLRAGESQKEIQRQKALKEGFSPKGIAASSGPETQNLRLIQLELKGIRDTISEDLKELDRIAKEREFLLSKITTPKTKGGEKEKAKEKPQKIADNTEESLLKSRFEQQKLLIEQSRDSNEQILNDETKTFQERLDALRLFTADQMSLINLEKKFEIDQEILKHNEVIAALEEAKKEKGANVAEINAQEAREVEATGERIRTIILKSQDSILKAGQQFNAGLRKLKDDRADITKEEQKQLEEYEDFTMGWLEKFRQLQYDKNKEWDKKDQDQKDKAIQDIKDLSIRGAEEMQATLLSFLTGSIDKEIAIIETRKRILDEDTQRRINQINLLGLTETERVKRTAQVEKQAQFENEQLEKRKRKLIVDRAKLEKAANIASIIANTAAAVIKALKDAPYPFNIALAVLTGAIGALQLARAIAAPLPQYKDGTPSAKKGLALVSEEGSELMKKDGKYYLTPPQPTLMEMAGGEQITPAHLTRDILNASMFTRSMTRQGLTSITPKGMTYSQADAMIEEIRDLKGVTGRNKVTLINEFHIESDAYIVNNVKRSRP